MSKLKFEKYIHGKKKKITAKIIEPVNKEPVINEEVIAVIGLALSMHLQDVHDYEKAIITIQKVMRPYSPWSSKIYGLRQIPFKIPRQYK
jgi:hypothetical protein